MQPKAIAALCSLAVLALLVMGASNLFPPTNSGGGGGGAGGSQVWTNDLTQVVRTATNAGVPLSLVGGLATVDTSGNLGAQSLTGTNLTVNTAVLVGTAQQLVSLANGGANTVLLGTTPPSYGFPATVPATDGGAITNLTIRYDTNAIPTTGVLTFGHAYFTNLQANVTLPAFTLGSAFYETWAMFATNSTGSDTKFTFPAGVAVALANGGGNTVTVTNKSRAMIFGEHYGTLVTNVWAVYY